MSDGFFFVRGYLGFALWQPRDCGKYRTHLQRLKTPPLAVTVTSFPYKVCVVFGCSRLHRRLFMCNLPHGTLHVRHDHVTSCSKIHVDMSLSRHTYIIVGLKTASKAYTVRGGKVIHKTHTSLVPRTLSFHASFVPASSSSLFST